MSEIYSQTKRNIIEIHRKEELSLSSSEYERFYKAQEKELWARIQKQGKRINMIIHAMKSMEELNELSAYIEENYQKLEERMEERS